MSPSSQCSSVKDMTSHWGVGTGAVSPPFPSAGGENSAELWLRVGTVSAKSPTSRKEREKWGTRPRIKQWTREKALPDDAVPTGSGRLFNWRQNTSPGRRVRSTSCPTVCYRSTAGYRCRHQPCATPAPNLDDPQQSL